MTGGSCAAACRRSWRRYTGYWVRVCAEPTSSSPRASPCRTTEQNKASQITEQNVLAVADLGFPEEGRYQPQGGFFLKNCKNRQVALVERLSYTYLVDGVDEDDGRSGVDVVESATRHLGNRVHIVREVLILQTMMWPLKLFSG